jgi:peptidyl-prolyl cis-trans isomerase D
MFDLFRSRSKAVRFLLGAILVMVAVMMVVTLVPGFGTGGGTDSRIAAEIGREALTLDEIDRYVRAQIQNRSVPREMAAILVPQVADRLIAQYAVAYQAERMGFQVSETDVAAAIRMVLPQLFDGDRFAGEQAYAATLAQEHMSIPQFENMLRKDLFVTKLRGLVAEGVVVSPQEIESEYRHKNDAVKIEFVVIPPAKYRSQVVVTPGEIQDYFGKNRAGFVLPEKRSLQVVMIDQAKVSQMVTVPEAELRRVYDTNKDAFREPERVHIRQILLKTTDKPQAEAAKVKARAEELLKQIRQGADFAELAKKNSEDPTSAAKGGDRDWIVRGQMAKAVEDAVFALKPKETSNVIAADYGFQIIQLLEKQEPRLRPFEEVKAQLTEERKRQLVFDSMQRLSDQARAALSKNPQAAEQVARSLNLEFTRADKIGATDPIPGIGPSAEMADAVDSLRKGEVSPIVQVGPARLAVAVVTDVFPARQAELADVESQIRSRLTTEKLGQLVDQKAREAMEKVKALNGDLKKAAQAEGLEWKEPVPFTRDGAAEGLGPASYVSEAFTNPPGYVFGPVTMAEQKFICKVVAQVPADMSKLDAAQRTELARMIRDRKASERVEVFEATLRDRLIREGKVKIHKDVIDRLVASYRAS